MIWPIYRLLSELGAFLIVTQISEEREQFVGRHKTVPVPLLHSLCYCSINSDAIWEGLDALLPGIRRCTNLGEIIKKPVLLYRRCFMASDRHFFFP